jgi:ribonuclease E
MPNSSHGGGISRKISNGADRKRLKSVIDDLALPSSMGCIVRTAGLERTKTEIKRDFDYLARLWDEIREKTMVSAAPALIHSDSDLIKRAIRDIYNSEIDEVFVEGDEGYRAAKDFMKLLMPSHAKRVQQYADPVPLFQRYGVEDQLGAMYQPVVTLKSGGYLVINPTEALVSIDINSGRSTREHNIEQTAFSTNIEAAYEIARQLRLRDMAGLVVIDFIDMEVGGNVRKVERAMRDALKNDRARIQVGRISGFGLMEMSRQRLRTGVLEASTRACPHCEGTGLVRTASSAGLSALRLLEEEAARGRGTRLVLRASQEAALYVLNNKRAELSEIETRYGVMIEVQSDGQTEGARMTVDVSGPPPANLPRFVPIVEADEDDAEDFIDDMDDEDEEEGGRAPAARNDEEGGDRARRKRSRRRRGRRDTEGRDGEGRDDNQDAPRAEREAAPEGDADADQAAGEDRAEAGEERGATDENGRRRRRGRRGGRGRRNNAEGASEGNGEGNAGDQAEGSEGETAGDAVTEVVSADAIDAAVAEAPKPKRRRGKAAAAADDTAVEAAVEAVVVEEVVAEAEVAEAPKPKRRRTKAVIAAEEAEAAAQTVAPVAEAAAPEAAPEVAAEAPAKPKRASRARKPAAEAAPAAEEAAPAPAPVAPRAAADMEDSAAGTTGDGAEANEEEGGERRRGWWQRTFGA